MHRSSNNRNPFQSSETESFSSIEEKVEEQTTTSTELPDLSNKLDQPITECIPAIDINNIPIETHWFIEEILPIIMETFLTIIFSRLNTRKDSTFTIHFDTLCEKIHEHLNKAIQFYSNNHNLYKYLDKRNIAKTISKISKRSNYSFNKNLMSTCKNFLANLFKSNKQFYKTKYQYRHYLFKYDGIDIKKISITALAFQAMSEKRMEKNHQYHSWLNSEHSYLLEYMPNDDQILNQIIKAWINTQNGIIFTENGIRIVKNFSSFTNFLIWLKQNNGKNTVQYMKQLARLIVEQISPILSNGEVPLDEIVFWKFSALPFIICSNSLHKIQPYDKRLSIYRASNGIVMIKKTRKNP